MGIKSVHIIPWNVIVLWFLVLIQRRGNVGTHRRGRNRTMTLKFCNGEHAEPTWGVVRFDAVQRVQLHCKQILRVAEIKVHLQ